MYAVVEAGHASRSRLVPGPWCHAIWRALWQQQSCAASTPGSTATATCAVGHATVNGGELPGGKHQQRQAAASWQGGGARPAAPPFQNSSLLAAHTGAATSWRGPQGSFQYEVARPHAPGSPASTATYATLSLNSTPSERIVPASLNSSSSSSSTIRASSSHAGGSESPSQQGGSRGGSSGKKRGTQLPTWLHILKRKRRQRERLKVQAGVVRRARRAGAASARPIKLDPYQSSGDQSQGAGHSGQPRPQGRGGSASGRVWAMDARELTAALTRVTSPHMMSRLLHPLLAVQTDAEEAEVGQANVLQLETQGQEMLPRPDGVKAQVQQDTPPGTDTLEAPTASNTQGTQSTTTQQQEEQTPALTRKDGLRVRAAQLAIVRAGNTLNGVQLTAALYSLVRLAGAQQQHQHGMLSSSVASAPQAQQQQLVQALHAALCRELALGGAQRLDARGVSAAVWCLGQLSVSQCLDPTPDAWAALVQRLSGPSQSSSPPSQGSSRSGHGRSSPGGKKQGGRDRGPKTLPGLLLLPPPTSPGAGAEGPGGRQQDAGGEKRPSKHSRSVGLTHQELTDLAAGLAWLRAGPADVWYALANAILARCSNSTSISFARPAHDEPTATNTQVLAPHHLAHLLTSLRTGQALLAAQADLQTAAAEDQHLLPAGQLPGDQEQNTQHQQQLQNQHEEQEHKEGQQSGEDQASQGAPANGTGVRMARGNNAAAAMQGSGSASGPSERIPGKPEPVPVAALLTAAQLSSLADEVVQGAPYATLKDLAMSLTALEALGLAPAPGPLVEASAHRVCTLLGRRGRHGTSQPARTPGAKAAGKARRTLFNETESDAGLTVQQGQIADEQKTSQPGVSVSPRDARALQQWFIRAGREGSPGPVNPAVRLLRKAAGSQGLELLKTGRQGMT